MLTARTACRPPDSSRIWDEATETPARLARLGVDLETVAQELETEGVKKFVQPFDKLFSSLEQRRQTNL